MPFNHSHIFFTFLSCSLLTMEVSASESPYTPSMFRTIKDKVTYYTTTAASYDTPSWKTVKPGTFFVCQCTNERCPSRARPQDEVFQGLLITDFGYKRSFDPIKTFYKGIPCPACHTHRIFAYHIKKMGFTNCRYVIKGALISDRNAFYRAQENRAPTETGTKEIKIDGNAPESIAHVYEAGTYTLFVCLTFSAYALLK